MKEPLLIESIRLEDGLFSNLDYHSDRMNRSCDMLSIAHTKYDLEDYLSHLTVPQEGLFKCRVLYDTSIKTIHYKPYKAKPIKTLKMVHADEIEYGTKLLLREELDALFAQRGDCDDIMIIKNGKVTDSYYGNLLFRKKGKWFTPKSYLLPGTQRQALLDSRKIQTTNISIQNLHEFEQVKVINAMLDLKAGPTLRMRDVVKR